MSTIGYDTSAMREWSGNIENCAEEYNTLIKKLYTTVDQFVSCDFSGGIAKELENSILSQRVNFYKLSNVLNEVAGLISTRATNIDNDTQDMKKMIDQNSIL